MVRMRVYLLACMLVALFASGLVHAADVEVSGDLRVYSGDLVFPDGSVQTTAALPCQCRATLMNLVTEPAGANCAYGGVKILVGQDANYNNILESSEVTQTKYVCNGGGGGSQITVPAIGTVTNYVVPPPYSSLQGVTVQAVSTSATVSATTNADGAYSLNLPAGTYTITYSKSGYQSQSSTQVVTVDTSIPSGQPQPTLNLPVVRLLTTIQATGTGNASGIITNALDGSGLAGLTLKLRAGANTQSGTIVQTTTTTTGGNYIFSGVTAGTYTAEVTSANTITAYFTVIVLGGTTIGNQNFSVSPILAAGETRVVLTWGAEPQDLDSHLTGPAAAGDTSISRFHVYYRDPVYDFNSVVYANLDTDDTTSYGPETITISSQMNGIYRYSVHLYYGASGSSFATSEAQVKVYRGSSLVATYNVPTTAAAADASNNVWTVFELNGSTITPINTISSVTDPGYVTAPTTAGSGPAAATDAYLMKNMPKK